MSQSQIQVVNDPMLRILVVDDEAVNRELLEIILSWEGFGVITAASGPEALALVEEAAPDLMLLDLMMPGMNGYEVTTCMKSNRATEHIPIIIVTAMGDRTSRARALAAGAMDVLTKPTDRAELCARVRRALSCVAQVGAPVLRVVTSASGPASDFGVVAEGPAVRPCGACPVHSTEAEDPAATAGRVYATLFESLAPVVGEAGIQALFARSLKLNQAGFPCLEDIRVTAESIASSVQLEALLVVCLRKQDPANARAIATAVYATFLRLLTGFIGAELVRQLVKSACPSIEELGTKEISE